MSEDLRNKIYGVGVAVFALMVAIGVIDAVTEQQ
ncbi:hypothetical protein JS278_01201 [Acidipropionibacterium virtanenii]|uniref:Uncharacterized protein n=1 Tax=Acidipropionibacterium virtanenii TaxID=2057246 RepID=A0A344USY0_9ACTN|nr:hypothetical protein JS278_01201 [Acidipropionibacterium virtanenii]